MIDPTSLAVLNTGASFGLSTFFHGIAKFWQLRSQERFGDRKHVK